MPDLVAPSDTRARLRTDLASAHLRVGRCRETNRSSRTGGLISSPWGRYVVDYIVVLMTEKLRQFSLESTLLLSSMPDGRVLAQSLTRPQFVAFGTAPAVLDEHRRFLERFLLEVRATDVASFESPKELELRSVVTKLERSDLPISLRRMDAIEIPVVVAAVGHDNWCLAPALNHTFYVRRGQDLDETIASELARVAAAADPSDLDLRRLLPAEESWLETVTVELVVGESGLAGRAQAMRSREIASQRRDQAREILASAGRFIRSSGPVVALRFRDEERKSLLARLAGSVRGSVAIVGDESVGKTALFRDWVATTKGEVLSTSVAQLIAGASGFGEWQDRVAKVLAAAELLDVVLHFENFGELFSSGGEGSVDIARALHGAITGQHVRVVGEISTDRFEAVQRTHAGLVAEVSPIRIGSLDAVQTTEILADRIRLWRKQPGADVAADVAAPIVRLTDRYMPYRAFPGKAVRFLDELRQNRALRSDEAGRPEPISLSDAYDAFANTTGIPSFLLRAEQPLLASNLIESIGKTMIGQKAAVELVAQTICTVKAEMQPNAKPLSTFLFVGPTGVGKTELARTLAAILFGSSDRLVRFDMSEYTDAGAADRLIRGVGGRDGLLTSRIRETPFCVLLLDEIEKADRTVHDLLLQVCGSGRLTDGRGRTTFFENTIIIMTSNLGSSHRSSPLGIAASVETEEVYMRAVGEAFRPEMVGRLDRIVPFASLDRAEVAQVADLAIAKIADRRGLAESGVRLVVTEAAVAHLAESGFSETYGVRALRRQLEAELVTPLAHLLSSLGESARGVLVWVATRNESSASVGNPRQRIERRENSSSEIVIEVFRREAVGGRVALRGLGAISSLRRRCDDLVALDEVSAIAERAVQLTADLAMMSNPKKRRRDQRRQAVRSAEIARVQTTQHRVGGAYQRVLDAQTDLHTAEELAIAALMGGDAHGGWGEEAEASSRELRRAMFWLLTTDQQDRNHCFLRLTRNGTPLAARMWLSELLAFGRRRGDEIEGFEPRRPTTDNPRRWGTRLDATALAQRAQNRPETLNPILLHISGRGAGVLYPVEAGLHRFHGFSSASEPAHLIIELVALTQTLPEIIWRSEALTVGAPSYIPKSSVTDRDRHEGASSVVVGDAVVETSKGYFEALEEIGLEHLLRRRDEAGIASVFVSIADVAEVADALAAEEAGERGE